MRPELELTAATTRRAGARTSLLILVIALTAVLRANAQSVVRWTTNYYTVTGETIRDVRRSLNQSRPWRHSVDADATTTWKVEWRSQFSQTPGGCASTGVSTLTTIVTTLPRYVPPTNASPASIERWKSYFPALARHEASHAQFGLNAAAAIERQVAAIGAAADCASLQRAMNETANQIVEQHRKEEREYDRRTRHGATEGARFP